MATVQTVLGPKDTATLGKTLIHEHVLIGYPGWFMDTRLPPFVRREALDRVVDAFQRLHDWGVKTVVDPCPMDLGRDVEFMAEISQRTGIDLICTTGVYFEAQGIPYTIDHLDVDQVAECFQKELEDGVARTGIRPGLLKIATGNGRVSDYERKMLTAAAKAAKHTGVTLLSHTENVTCGHDQIDIVTGQGVPHHHLLVGHCCGRDDHAYQKSIAERGVYVGFDRFGIEIFNSDANRIKNLKELLDAGFRDSVMVSHDTVNCWMGGIPGIGNPEQVAQIVPNWKLTHLFENVFPALVSMGVSQSDLDHIVTENPKRYFERQTAPL